ncbi:hypothetical protein Lal_00025462 [Lupinus albus]|uniref:Uncharacterized protein n=1 Tax=Lupinus albus TaxID=3870 RepID=A0A6A5NYT4_LUPAL|nr:hypothetical protein Lalb_Chr10g0100731 [Lupinus albus]KAF1890129.1 hypothetical protein Lal_00025462 [Lupinus albus]
MANPPRVRPWLRLASLDPVSPTPQPSQPNANAAPIVTPPPKKATTSIPSPQAKTPFIQSQKQSQPPSPLALEPSKGKDTIQRKVLDSEDYDMRAITISGENKGAYMKIVQHSNKPNYHHKNGNSEDYELEDSGNGNRKNKSEKERTLSSPAMAVYVNSNVQCVNNSMLYHTTCSTHDPGVHLTLKKRLPFQGTH